MQVSERVSGQVPWSSLVLPFTFFCPTDRLATGQQDSAPRDLLAVRLHLDNGTALPTAAVQLRWQVGVMPFPGKGATDTSLCPTLTWDPSLLLQMLMPVPVPVGYVVLYRSLLPVATSWVQHDAGGELSATIPALRRGYKYEFKVRPYTGGTQGSDSNSRHLWIPEEGASRVPRDGWVVVGRLVGGPRGLSIPVLAVPSAAPQRVTVSQAEAGNGTIVVSWEPPPPEAHNGVIRGYQVWGSGTREQGWGLLGREGHSKGIHPKREPVKDGGLSKGGNHPRSLSRRGLIQKGQPGWRFLPGHLLVASKGVHAEESSLGDSAKGIHQWGSIQEVFTQEGPS